MPTPHTVQQGECITMIAAIHGFIDKDGPARIWNDPANAALRKKRRDDGNVLAPGDVVMIPDGDPKTVSKPVGQEYTFKASSLTKQLRIVLRDTLEAPLAGAPWTLALDGGGERKGTTGGDGLVVVTDIPPLVTGATLTVEGGTPVTKGKRAWPLAIGFLTPLFETRDDGLSGVFARLQNLGFVHRSTPRGRWTGALPAAEGYPDLDVAICRFQTAYGLPPTGVADEATRGKLLAAHENQAQVVPAAPVQSSLSVHGKPRIVAKSPPLPLCPKPYKYPVLTPTPRYWVSPVTTNVLVVPRQSRCGLCASEVDCLDNENNFVRAVARVATEVDGDAKWFMGVMHSETGGSFSPTIRNEGGTATGLIQLTDANVIKVCHTPPKVWKSMCRIRQLVGVAEYFAGAKTYSKQVDYQKLEWVAVVNFLPGKAARGDYVFGVRDETVVHRRSEPAVDKKGNAILDKDKKPVMKEALFVIVEGKEHPIAAGELPALMSYYHGNPGLDASPKDGIITRPEYPLHIRELLDDTANHGTSADKAHEIQAQQGSGAPDYEIVNPNDTTTATQPAAKGK